MEKELMKLVLSWEHSARQQFRCSDSTSEEIGKRVMDHGAMVYFNCSQQVRSILCGISPPPSPTQEER